MHIMSNENGLRDPIGQNITDVSKPAAILDVAKIRRHCTSMLEAARTLGVGFRAHVKTHKVRSPQFCWILYRDIKV